MLKLLVKNINILVTQQGFKDTHEFLDKTFHIDNYKPVIVITSVLTFLSTCVEWALGMEGIVCLGILVLFGLEMWTGIKASKLEGIKFNSKKFPRGWVKLFVYFSFIGCANIFAQNIQQKYILGFEVNIYVMIHYFFINFAIVNLFISNIENCNRLGWTEYFPLISWFQSFLNNFTKKKDL
jgi:phage-related holin